MEKVIAVLMRADRTRIGAAGSGDPVADAILGLGVAGLGRQCPRRRACVTH